MIVLLSAVASTLIAICQLVARPVALDCPRGTYVEGVRPSGLTACVASPARGDEWPTINAAPGLRFEARIYCAPGMEPRVINHRRAECRRARTGT